MKFEEILVIASIFTGLVWLLDAKLFKAKRLRLTDGKQVKEPVLVEYSRSFFPVLFLVLALRSFVAEPFRIPSGSMKPTLLVGDFILVNKFDYGLKLPIIGTKLVELNKPRRGDIVVFRHYDRKDLIKRVVGLPGDHIMYRDKVLYINNQPVSLTDGQTVQDEQVVAFFQREILNTKPHDIYTYPHIFHFHPVNDIVVPVGSYFVLGDNRDASQDSRYWGCVKEENIIGRAFAVWWSWDWKGWSEFSIRWGRVGKTII